MSQLNNFTCLYRAGTEDEGSADEVIVSGGGDRCDWDDSIILDVFNDAIQSHRTKVCHKLPSVHVLGIYGNVIELR